MNSNKVKPQQKDTPGTAPNTKEIKTDFPLSEKDEVKQAEEKTQSHSKKPGSNN